MTFLVSLWFLLLAILAGIIIYGQNQEGESDLTVPENFHDFFMEEFARMEEFFRMVLERLHPHGKRALVSGGTLLKKGHDAFLEKIFGGIEVEKGKVTSFFVKRIAEQKELLRKKGGGKMMK